MSIRLSEKHGVNPSICVCALCGDDTGELVLPGLLKGDVEAPRRAVWFDEPCATCRGFMKSGIILISVRDGESGSNPYRTGSFAVITEEAVRRLLRDDKIRADVLRNRVCFIEDVNWLALGLPVGGAA